eukprot:PRCOL_00006968-RA
MKRASEEDARPRRQTRRRAAGRAGGTRRGAAEPRPGLLASLGVASGALPEVVEPHQTRSQRLHQRASEPPSQHRPGRPPLGQQQSHETIQEVAACQQGVQLPGPGGPRRTRESTGQALPVPIVGVAEDALGELGAVTVARQSDDTSRRGSVVPSHGDDVAVFADASVAAVANAAADAVVQSLRAENLPSRVSLASEDGVGFQAQHSSQATTNSFDWHDDTQLDPRHPRWGLPRFAHRYFEKKLGGSPRLHRWQASCLEQQARTGGNLVYSAPTSGGKSIVADMILLRAVSATNRAALVVVPFVSLVNEKVEEYERLFRGTGRGVKAYHGAIGHGPPERGTAVCVATIEKANGLVNELVLEKTLLDTFCIVVVDELHMVADPSRGHLCELLMAKLLYIGGGRRPGTKGYGNGREAVLEGTAGADAASTDTKKDLDRARRRQQQQHGQTPDILLVGMSATLPGAGAVHRWLGGAAFRATDSDRPVPLSEWICVYTQSLSIRPATGASSAASAFKQASGAHTSKAGFVDIIDPVDDRSVRQIDCCSSPDMLAADAEVTAAVALVQETLSGGGAALLFCPTKAKCWQLAKGMVELLRRVDPSVLVPSDDKANKARNAALEELQVADRSALPKAGGTRGQQGQGRQGTADDILQECIQAGVGWHNSALTNDERKVVEGGYRQGGIRVLCATTTLAAGVNLPARRVLIMGLKAGRDLHDPTTIRQMCGRAGRAGFDTIGEAFVVVPSSARTSAKQLLDGARSQGEVSATAVGGDAIRSCFAPPADDGVRQPACPSKRNAKAVLGGNRAMRQAVLEAVVGGWVATASDVEAFLACTLLAATGGGTSKGSVASDTAVEALRWCERQRLLAFDKSAMRWVACSRGSAMTRAPTMSPEQILAAIADAQKVVELKLLDTPVALCWMAVPEGIAWDCAVRWESTQWNCMYQAWDSSFSKHEKALAIALGVDEGFFFQARRGKGAVPASTDIPSGPARAAVKLYFALALARLAEGVEVQEVTADMRKMFPDIILPDLEALRESAGMRVTSLGGVFEALAADPRECRQMRVRSIALDSLAAMLTKLAPRVSAGGNEEKTRALKALATRIVRAAGKLWESYSCRQAAHIEHARICANAARHVLCCDVEAFEPDGLDGFARLWAASNEFGFEAHIVESRTADRRQGAPRSVLAGVAIALVRPTGGGTTPGVTTQADEAFADVLKVYIGLRLDAESGVTAGVVRERWEVVCDGLRRLAGASHDHITAMAGVRCACWDLRRQLVAIEFGVCGRPLALASRLVGWRDTLIAECLLAGGQRHETSMALAEVLEEYGRGRDGHQGLAVAVATAGCELFGERGSGPRDACERAALALALAEHQRRAFACNDGVASAYARMEMPLIRALASMEEEGIGFNGRAADKCRAAARKCLSGVEASLSRAFNGEKVRWESPEHLSDALFGGRPLRLRPPDGAPKLRSGRISTRSEVLEEMACTEGVVDLVLEARQLQRLIGNLDSYLTCAASSVRLSALPSDSSAALAMVERVHTSWLQCAAATGRLVSEGPNLQCVQRQHSARSTSHPSARACFVARSPGNVLVSVDYSEAELRVLAAMANDAALCDLLASGCDIFQQLADSAGCARAEAKRLVYSRLYSLGTASGSGPAFDQSFDNIFGTSLKWLVSTSHHAEQKGFVSTVSGRQRTLPAKVGSRGERVRQLASAIVQGSLSDVVKVAIVDVQAELQQLGAVLVLCIHDELVAECAEADAARVAQALASAMICAPSRLGLANAPRMATKAKVGPSWGAMRGLPVSDRGSAAGARADCPATGTTCAPGRSAPSNAPSTGDTDGPAVLIRSV